MKQYLFRVANGCNFFLKTAVILKAFLAKLL